MFTDSPGADRQRLLPTVLEDRIIAALQKGTGFALLAAVSFLWLSLITWSASDPSLTHATGGATRNWFGPLGAIASDILLQTFGFASIVVLLAPMFWGLELACGGRIPQIRMRLAFFPLAVLLIAAGLSALPVIGSWPLHHGLGGLIGDAIHGLGTSLFAMISPERASVASGALFLLAGFSSLGQSIGVSRGDLANVLVSSVNSLAREDGSSWHENLRAEAERLALRLRGASFPRGEPKGQDPNEETGGEDASPEERREPTFGDRMPASVAKHRAWSPHAGTDATSDDHSMNGAVVDVAGEAARAGEQLLDAMEEEDSLSEGRSIAARFAPRRAEEPSSEPVEQPPAPRPGSAFLKGLTFRRGEPQYQRPSLNLLKRPTGPKSGLDLSQTALRGTSRLLEDVLADFGVKGEIRDVRPGPVVTLFEFEPQRGTKSSRIISLADDIARSMSVTSVRIAVVPGRNVIGIELPNVRREPVLLREMLEHEAFRASDATLPLALGKSIGGDPVVTDLARMPHLLVAGTTGSGKSVGVNAMILSLLWRYGPEDLRLLLIDPKMLELSVYNGIPHLVAPVVTDAQKAVAALSWAVSEMEERYKRMAKLSVRSIEAFNNRVRHAKKRGEMISRTVQTGFDRTTGAAIYETEAMDLVTMPLIVIVVDEFADLMVSAGKEIEAAVQRLAQMARAAGIHIVMATQRPSVDVVTGTIKANFPTRISFKVASKIDSRTILNEQGAEQLLGQGDMLLSGGSGTVVRVHGAFVSDDEVESVAAALRSQGEPQYLTSLIDELPDAESASTDGRGGSGDDLYDKAVAIVVRDQKASTSYLQRRLGIGYNRAADLIERMERHGVVGPPGPGGKRDIL